ncbi:hypothetical protein Q7P37_002284 [Cladosporium fusiforme]
MLAYMAMRRKPIGLQPYLFYVKISTALHPCVLGINHLDTVLPYKQTTDFVVTHTVEVSNRYKDGNMALWNLITVLLLLLASIITAGETVNGATGAINDTVPTTFENEATVYTIQVGKEKETYTPNSINPGPGDIISFVFYSGNHSVIKAEYGYPCIPYENLETATKDKAFTALPVWNLTVNTTRPTFFYCGLAGGCAGWGMVGALNADTDHSIATQIKIAREAEYVLTPGQPLPADVSTSMASLAASATTVTLLALPTPEASTTATPGDGQRPREVEAPKKSRLVYSLAWRYMSHVINSSLFALSIAMRHASWRSCKSRNGRQTPMRGPFTDTIPVLSGRSKASSMKLQRNEENHNEPGNRKSEPMSTYSTELPPYARIVPQQHVEHSFHPVEADSIALNGNGHDDPFAGSPGVYRSDTFDGFTSPQSHSSLQNMYQRLFHTSEMFGINHARHTQSNPNSQVVHEMEAASSLKDDKGPPGDLSSV